MASIAPLRRLHRMYRRERSVSEANVGELGITLAFFCIAIIVVPSSSVLKGSGHPSGTPPPANVLAEVFLTINLAIGTALTRRACGQSARSLACKRIDLV